MDELYMTQIEVITMLLRTHHADLTPTEKFVLVTLSSFYPQIFPSQATIAKMTDYSKRTIHNAVMGLVEKDYILKRSGTMSRGESPSGNTSNAYILNPVRCGLEGTYLQAIK